MRVILRLFFLAAAFALITAFVDWWAVPILGMVWGLVAARETRPMLTAAASAALGWAVLLVWTGLHGPVGAVATKVGGVMGVPGWLLVVVTLLFPAVLAGGGAGVLAQRRA